MFWRDGLSFFLLCFSLRALQMRVKDFISHLADHLGSWWEHKPAAHAHSTSLSAPPKPSPQGSVLHRWVCSDTLVRLKSQAGFINSYSESMDTPFCIVTNTRINPLCPGVLQNYISSYMIKSDWLHSAFPLRLSEITVCI